MKNNIYLLLALFLAAIFSPLNAPAQIATGGQYTLDQSVIASGGGESGDAIYKIAGTTGQIAAGTYMSGGDFTQIGGFWTPPLFAPTAAGLTVGGRVVDGKNIGISDAIVTLTGGMLTAPRVKRTNPFGYFKFEDVEAGWFYVLQVQHRRYGFRQNSEAFTLTENRTDIVFYTN